MLVVLLGASPGPFWRRSSSGWPYFWQVLWRGLLFDGLPACYQGPAQQEWLLFLIGGIIGAILVSALFDWALIILSAVAGATLIVQAFQFSSTINLLLFGVLCCLASACRPDIKGATVKNRILAEIRFDHCRRRAAGLSLACYLVNSPLRGTPFSSWIEFKKIKMIAPGVLEPGVNALRCIAYRSWNQFQFVSEDFQRVYPWRPTPTA